MDSEREDTVTYCDACGEPIFKSEDYYFGSLIKCKKGFLREIYSLHDKDECLSVVAKMMLTFIEGETEEGDFE
jgi:hypothetical protein